MFKNFLMAAIATLAAKSFWPLLMFLRLSLGIACFSLFMLYAVNEFNYDKFNKKSANIYRVNVWSEARGDEQGKGNAFQPMPLGPAMKHDLPGVEDYVRFRRPGVKTS